MDTERAGSSVEPLRPPWYDQVEEISEQEARALFKLGIDVRYDYSGNVDFECSKEGIEMELFLEDPDHPREGLFFYLIK